MGIIIFLLFFSLRKAFFKRAAPLRRRGKFRLTFYLANLQEEKNEGRLLLFAGVRRKNSFFASFDGRCCVKCEKYVSAFVSEV